MFHQKSMHLRALFCRSILENRRSLVCLLNTPKKTSQYNNKQCYLLSLQSNPFSIDATVVGELDYEIFCVETLDSLNDYFEELVESTNELKTADVVNNVRSR